jgi:hypothetical protein
MAERVYGIWSEVLTTELGDRQVYLTDEKRQVICLPNLLAIKDMRDYLNKVLEKYGKEYFKNGGL